MGLVESGGGGGDGNLCAYCAYKAFAGRDIPMWCSIVCSSFLYMWQ